MEPAIAGLRRSPRRAGAGDELHGVIMPTVGLADAELLALDGALEKLALIKPDHSKLLELRYFAGMTGDEAAVALGLSPATADRMARFAKAWLQVELGAKP